MPIHELSNTYTAQQNGTVERYGGVISTMARTLLIEAKLAMTFWPYAYRCACCIRNMLPTQGKRTPYELFMGRNLRLVGCVFLGHHVMPPLSMARKRDKLGERSVAGRLVGYSSVSKGYLVWVPEFARS